MDVLSFTLAQNSRVNSLKLDNVTSVMPQIISLTNSKYETHLMAGLSSALNLLRHFAQGMIDLKMTPINPREVDLAREDRIRKADECINQFQRFSKCKGFYKALAGERQQKVQETATSLNAQLMHLLNLTRAHTAQGGADQAEGREPEAD